MKFLTEGVEGTAFGEFQNKLFLSSYGVGTTYWSTLNLWAWRTVKEGAQLLQGPGEERLW